MDRTYESHIPPEITIITTPCSDPEGCKHFKDEIALQDENAKLKERGNEKARLLRLEVQEAVEALIGCEDDKALKILEQALKDKDNG